jgi:hypothetical protein
MQEFAPESYQQFRHNSASTALRANAKRLEAFGAFGACDRLFFRILSGIDLTALRHWKCRGSNLAKTESACEQEPVRVRPNSTSMTKIEHAIGIRQVDCTYSFARIHFLADTFT